MIDQALNFLIDDLNLYLAQRYAIQPLVALYNIAHPDWKNLEPDASATGQIFANLINVHENGIYRNHPSRNGHGVEVKPMRLELYLLLAFKSKQYAQALKLLSAVLEYYHRKPVHTVLLTDFNGDPYELDLEVSYHNIDLEDSNNMWSNLGGEQQPFAIYRVSVMEIIPNVATGPVPINAINIL